MENEILYLTKWNSLSWHVEMYSILLACGKFRDRDPLIGMGSSSEAKTISVIEVEHYNSSIHMV